MTEHDFQHILQDALDLYVEDNGGTLRIQTFEEAGVLTNNTGLVITLDDTTFQLTIIQA